MANIFIFYSFRVVDGVEVKVPSVIPSFVTNAFRRACNEGCVSVDSYKDRRFFRIRAIFVSQNKLNSNRSSGHVALHFLPLPLSLLVQIGQKNWLTACVTSAQNI